MKQSCFEILALATLLLTLSGVACQQAVLSDDGYDDRLTVSIEDVGSSHADLNGTVAQALNICQVRDILNNTRHRLLSSELRSPSSELYGDTKDETEMFQARVYDYTHGRIILINGIIFDPWTYNIALANTQPHPSAEELAEAARIAGIRPGEFVSGYMPPFTSRDFPDGTSHRLVHLAISSAHSSRLVYVNMNNRTVESSRSAGAKTITCEAPKDAQQTPLDAGAPGTANLVITQNGKVLWTLQVTRPSASSGTNGGGIELRNVKYRGKSVLYQASVPILNVEYEQRNIPGCGPYYRDWQNQEYPLQCEGKDFAPWLRLCNSPAKTILDPPHNDGGDFIGVAVYIEGQEVVLKSQMWAGWYRYISEWRFHVDGTLKPRWGFGGVLSGDNCVCQIHHHHVYWRLDFDIVTAGNNLVREFNKPPIFPGQNYHDKIYEIKRPRDPSHNRHWEISGRTGETYSLIPGPDDGTSDDFGVGDVWVLRYHEGELDDGVGFVKNIGAKANIDKFMNGEPVKDTDVVIWYGAHFKHDQSHEECGQDGCGHRVGPDIRPVKW